MLALLMHPIANFNPRPSYEGRLNSSNGVYYRVKFQSTPLIRGATRADA